MEIYMKATLWMGCVYLNKEPTLTSQLLWEEKKGKLNKRKYILDHGLTIISMELVSKTTSVKENIMATGQMEKNMVKEL